ncbi:MAG: class I SAM-dependent methyltransferase [bacterium]|nr:class I SAM-dependent methyltransferase [bacterium]MDT8364983.1 class I SAM-dependent methyltransferase [bacterium]
MSSDFHEKSYESHSRLYEEHARGSDKHGKAQKWLLQNTVDAWRHNRKLALLKPLLEAWQDHRWITVGDGRYGQEAHYIQQNGGRAVATDISDTLLEESAGAGYISEYSRQNAESLSYPDNEFDLAVCKESLHHFPRPMVALYEMIRVSKKAVVLIEPTDLKIGATLRWKLFRALVDTARKITGRSGGHQIFEEAGNYVYAISRLEMEKVALGMNMPAIAVKGINDYYVKGLEEVKADRSSRAFKKVRRRIVMNDLFCRLGFKPHSTTCVILLHQPIESDIQDRLSEAGFEIVDLPENPYIDKGRDS